MGEGKKQNNQNQLNNNADEFKFRWYLIIITVQNSNKYAHNSKSIKANKQIYSEFHLSRFFCRFLLILFVLQMNSQTVDCLLIIVIIMKFTFFIMTIGNL